MTHKITLDQLYRNPITPLPSVREEREVPLRAKSVCLAERPRSKYDRNAKSADFRRYQNKQFIYQANQTPNANCTQKTKKVTVKQQKRNIPEKVPCAVSVQNISIPMKYADSGLSTSKPKKLERADSKTKSILPKQVDKKRLCSLVSGKETENKLLVEISEAEQVSDFERILNSNAILWERGTSHTWRRCSPVSAQGLAPRPCSSYSLHNVSQTYHYLFRQHEESLQSIIDKYRQAEREEQTCPTSFLQDDWYENLQDLSEFYEDDSALRQEIENITDKIISEEIKDVETPKTEKNKNFNVNLSDLIGLRVHGEGFSPISHQDGPSPDVEKSAELDIYGSSGKEWLDPIMNSDDRQNSQERENSVDCVAQSLDSVKIESDAKVPTITFSNCCDGTKSELPNNKDLAIRLSVPSIDSIDESRPPMM